MNKREFLLNFILGKTCPHDAIGRCLTGKQVAEEAVAAWDVIDKATPAKGVSTLGATTAATLDQGELGQLPG